MTIKQQSNSTTLARLRRRRVKTVALGCLTAGFLTTTASAQPPYEPDESIEQGEYPDQPGTDDHGDNDVAGLSGQIDTSGPIPVHPPTGDGLSECSSSYDTNYTTDVLKLLDQGIDFGDNLWVGNAPLGVASVQWGVECGFFDADVVGTLHLDGVRGRSGRIHAAFFFNGELQETVHSRILTATDNGHFSRSVHLASSAGTHVHEVHVCTEISDDGIRFESVNCKERFID